jgi:hypothetical protein
MNGPYGDRVALTRSSFPWTLAVVPLPVLVFCSGLALVALPILYDLDHICDVVAMYQGELGLLTDAAWVHRARTGAWVMLLTMGCTALAALALTVATLLGSNVARILLCIASSPGTLGLACAIGSVVGGSPALGASYDETFPLWYGLAPLVGLLLVLLGGLAALVLLVLPATNDYLRHPDPGHSGHGPAPRCCRN